MDAPPQPVTHVDVRCPQCARQRTDAAPPTIAVVVDFPEVGWQVMGFGRPPKRKRSHSSMMPGQQVAAFRFDGKSPVGPVPRHGTSLKYLRGRADRLECHRCGFSPTVRLAPLAKRAAAAAADGQAHILI